MARKKNTKNLFEGWQSRLNITTPEFKPQYHQKKKKKKKEKKICLVGKMS
jgi:hypothetical protein